VAFLPKDTAIRAKIFSMSHNFRQVAHVLKLT